MTNQRAQQSHGFNLPRLFRVLAVLCGLRTLETLSRDFDDLTPARARFMLPGKEPVLGRPPYATSDARLIARMAAARCEQMTSDEDAFKPSNYSHDRAPLSHLR